MAGCTPGAVAIHPPRPTGAVAERCAALGNALPERLESLRPRVISPRSPLVHAWGNPAVVLTCGVGRPAGYSATSETAEVNGVGWFEQTGTSAVVWTALRPSTDHGSTVNVQLVVPTHYQAQGAFLVDLAQPLKTDLP